MTQQQTGNKGLAIILIIAGTLLLMAQLDVLIIPWYVWTWQFLLMAIGFLMIALKRRWEPGITLITIGAAFLFARIYDISYRDLWKYWPALLIIAGVTMLVRHLKNPKKESL